MTPGLNPNWQDDHQEVEEKYFSFSGYMKVSGEVLAKDMCEAVKRIERGYFDNMDIKHVIDLNVEEEKE